MLSATINFVFLNKVVIGGFMNLNNTRISSIAMGALLTAVAFFGTPDLSAATLGMPSVEQLAKGGGHHGGHHGHHGHSHHGGHHNYGHHDGNYHGGNHPYNHGDWNGGVQGSTYYDPNYYHPGATTAPVVVPPRTEYVTPPTTNSYQVTPQVTTPISK